MSPSHQSNEFGALVQYLVCGRELPSACRSCERQMTSYDLFCSHCGSSTHHLKHVLIAVILVSALLAGVSTVLTVLI